MIGSVAFLAGIMLLQAQSNLPSLYWSSALLLIPLLRKIPALRIPLWMLAGFLWALLFATLALDERLDPSLEGQDLVITGTVGSIPQVREPGLRFRFDVDENPELPRQVLLSWYGRHEGISAGQRWRLRVRLKQPNGLMNPGSFDYEKWLFQQGIHAVGYIREDEEQVNVLLEESAGGVNIDRLREYLYRKIQQALVDDPNAGVIAALAIGEWQDMSHEQWDLLARTGTSHLMTISGMHISLVAGFVFFLFRWSWRRVAQLVELIPAKKAAALAGMTAAMVYAALAGFTIPTQRALVMLGVVFGGVILLRTLTPARTLALALLAVLLIDPLAVLSYGFWLSFASVAIILFGMHGQLSATGLWQRWGRVHWVIFVGLTPLTLLLFRQIMGGAPLANLVAVPLVDTTVVPLPLIGTLLTPLFDTAGAALLQVASWLLDRLWLWLEWVAEFRWAQWWQHVPPLWTVACGLVGMVLLLSPKGIPGRWLGWLWMMPIWAC